MYAVSLSLSHLMHTPFARHSLIHAKKDLHNEADLLCRLIGRALQNLHCEVSGKRHNLAGHEAVFLGVGRRGQGRAGKQGGQVKGSQGVKHDNLVRCISIKALIQGEVGRVVVKRLVECRFRGGICAGETSDEFLQVALALSGRDGGAGTVVVVKGLGINWCQLFTGLGDGGQTKSTRS